MNNTDFNVTGIQKTENTSQTYRVTADVPAGERTFDLMVLHKEDATEIWIGDGHIHRLMDSFNVDTSVEMIEKEIKDHAQEYVISLFGLCSCIYHIEAM